MRNAAGQEAKNRKRAGYKDAGPGQLTCRHKDNKGATPESRMEMALTRWELISGSEARWRGGSDLSRLDGRRIRAVPNLNEC